MSVAYNRRKKDRRAKRTKEEKDILRKIRKGILPRFFFKRVEDNPKLLDRKPPKYKNHRFGGLSLKLLSTTAMLKKI